MGSSPAVSQLIVLRRPPFPFLIPRMKTVCSLFVVILGAASLSAPAQQPQKKNATQAVRKVSVDVIPNLVKFDTVRFDVHAGSPVELSFRNGCVIPHNLVIFQPGSEPAVLAAVEAMGAEGAEKQFVPSISAIVAATKLLPSGQKQTLRFTAPEAEGEYPYVCTFPGHWFTMRGVMRVVGMDKTLDEAVKDPVAKNAGGDKVGDALKRAKITHHPLGTWGKPLVMRTFAPDPGLDPAVFSHHSPAKPGIKYDPKTREDITQAAKNASGEEIRVPQLVAAQPGVVGAIAVNHGPGFSYVWDSTECRLLYAWRGGFLNMNPYWGKEPGSGREKNYIPKLEGDIVYLASGAAPLSSAPGEVPVFGGYRMVEGAPEFWYTLGQDVIHERVIPAPERGFAVRVRVEGGARSWKVSSADGERVRVEAGAGAREFVVHFKDAPPPSRAAQK